MCPASPSSLTAAPRPQEWALHKRATKYPGKFLPVDTDFGKEAEAAAAAVAPEGDPGAGEGAAGPVVDPRVESLLSTLFDIETYKCAPPAFGVRSSFGRPLPVSWPPRAAV